MLTQTMRSHCLGPFVNIKDLLMKISSEEEKTVKSSPIKMPKAFNYYHGMVSVQAESCAVKNALLCNHSTFLEIGKSAMRIIGCKRDKDDQLCPFGCDEWKID